MKTPVIIPAYNEAERIGATLASLDRATVEPFVVVNGEEGLLETVTTAEKYTTNVFIAPEQGKLPAVQLALRKLLEHDGDALASPVLMTDADTQPLRPKQWADAMTSVVAGTISKSAAGPVYFNDGPDLDCVVRNARRFLFVRQQRATYRGVIGSNMVMNLAGDETLIEEVMTMPHIWPGEDRYLLQRVSDYNPERYTQLTSLGASVLTSVRFFPPLLDKFKIKPSERKKQATRHYQARRARGATHYYSDDDTLHSYDQ